MSVSSEKVGKDDAHTRVPSSPLAHAADKKYYNTKRLVEVGLDVYGHAWALAFAGWRALAGDFNYRNAFEASRDRAVHDLTHTTRYSTRAQATAMRAISDDLLEGLLKTKKFTRDELENSSMRKQCNDKLWALDDQSMRVNRVTSDDVAPLFDPRKPKDWPNIILTANHARASSSDDLVELLKGVEQIARDAGGKPLNLHRLQNAQAKPQVAGKTITLLACHTARDIFCNGADLLDRRCTLEEDAVGNADPAKRSLEHMSPAAMRIAKLMLKSMAESPAHSSATPLIDLDRATSAHRDAGNPFVADAHAKNVVLRADANAIAQHFKLVGYSKGANTVTDALRFFYMECTRLGDRLKIRDAHGHTHVATAKEIKTLIENIGLLSLAPGEVPLTHAEKHVVGIKRTTILNTHDVTAGHLVNPDAKDYDVWSDKLVTIEGSDAELGHSIRSALGGAGKPGYIMDPANKLKAGYRVAQDDVRAFFASNHKLHAITTLCLSPEGSENVMYIQFAPGVSRAEERAVESHIAQAFKQNGFEGATVQSDLANRRRLRVVLDHDAVKHPCITNDSEHYQVASANHAKVTACKNAFKSLQRIEGAGLFVTNEAIEYFDNLLSIPDKVVADVEHKAMVVSSPLRQGKFA